MTRIPAGNTTNVHYNFVVAKPLVLYNTVLFIEMNLDIGEIWMIDIFSRLIEIIFDVGSHFICILRYTSGFATTKL